MRVLVCEDGRDAGTTLRMLLELDGHQVAVCADGQTCLDCWRDTRPDVVVIDIGLPARDGYSVAAAIRDEDAGRATALVALTGYGGADYVRRAFAAGFDAYLVKSGAPNEVREVVKRLGAGKG